MKKRTKIRKLTDKELNQKIKAMAVNKTSPSGKIIPESHQRHSIVYSHLIQERDRRNPKPVVKAETLVKRTQSVPQPATDEPKPKTRIKSTSTKKKMVK